MDGNYLVLTKPKKIGLSELPSLDLFKGITMDEGNVDFVINQSFPGKEDPNVDDSKLDDDEESEQEDERNPFDVLNE